MRDSTSATRAAIARDDQEADAALRSAVDSILLADAQPSADALAPFRDPRRAADSISYTARVIRAVQWRSPPLRILRDRLARDVLAGRLARAFGAVRFSELDLRAEPFTGADLRLIAAGDGQRAAGARRALACLGEIAWRGASREERAAWLLGALCRLARGETP